MVAHGGARVKFIDEPTPVLELTRRNLETLLMKLDDPLSHRTLLDPDGVILVRAVENEAHYAAREPGPIFMPSTGELL
jgi:hypothetical protein